MKSLREYKLKAFKLSLLFLTLTAGATGEIGAIEHNQTVIEKIEKGSKGEITIDIPQNILDLILRQSAKKDPNAGMKNGINKLAGYRIQVFSDGRNQSTLEARAKARGSAILAKFPKYRGQVYTYSSSPNWYTRVGNFRTNAEANAALTEMKRAFPNFASEMRIVKCQIVVIK
ncbi:MAG: SPOR domain-containing protein [Muribaculaceae bacterium]|nr:SPOR domain-containing protein [Muribaculaceae bacterium]MDE6753128.1 SPOR domain-containing protein [Muribaculaceae bacterium]